MKIEPTPFSQTNPSLHPATPHTKAEQSSSSTLSSSKEPTSCFMSVLTFLPRTIWNFCRYLFCCLYSRSGPTLAQQIESDPKRAARKTVDSVEKKGLDEGIKSLERLLESLREKDDAWKTAQKPHLLAYAREIHRLAAESADTKIQSKLAAAVAAQLKDFT